VQGNTRPAQMSKTRDLGKLRNFFLTLGGAQTSWILPDLAPTLIKLLLYILNLIYFLTCYYFRRGKKDGIIFYDNIGIHGTWIASLNGRRPSVEIQLLRGTVNTVPTQ